MSSIRDDALAKARILAESYGHKLARPVVYTQGVALTARMQLAELDDAYPNPRQDIEGLTAEYVDDPGSIFDREDGTANYAGISWASLLADDSRYKSLLIATADRFTELGEDGFPRVLDRDYRVEDMFFAGTILQRATRLTGEARYADLAADFMLDCADRLLQPNGLYWHCLSSPYFWGRGNGFAALGFSEALIGHRGDKRERLIERHVEHLRGLKTFQDPDSGMWRQVVDRPGTYTEGSSTCMIGIAIATGISGGWLNYDEWARTLHNAWRGTSAGINEEGHVTRVCVGTGPLKNTEEYAIRDAVTGFDDRGGAMALWFAVEMLNCGS
jgi:rhamnogalacturonyl hydrolase YesR